MCAVFGCSALRKQEPEIKVNVPISNDLPHPSPASVPALAAQQQVNWIRKWRHLSWGQLFLQRWRQKSERRMIVAFVLAGLMLSASAWHAFQDRRIEADLKSATVVETLDSPKITAQEGTTPGDPSEQQTVVVDIEIDKDGSPIIPPGTSQEVAQQLKQTRFSPALHNNRAVKTRVPFMIRVLPVVRQEAEKRSHED